MLNTTMVDKISVYFLENLFYDLLYVRVRFITLRNSSDKFLVLSGDEN